MAGWSSKTEHVVQGESLKETADTTLLFFNESGVRVLGLEYESGCPATSDKSGQTTVEAVQRASKRPDDVGLCPPSAE